MLKALELAGFKSFADKTRFDFPPGITVVVGPNGSGKSNIVDAIKWVLGEQSAKSLRGKEMADVIFKGSGQGGRKMLNTAEATIVFDNSEGRLGVDAPEVHVTRRVYRSGEGEYLINGQACRLKDVRDLFRGTGVGADAYSLIEQGKVDNLLQASPRDRRAIFEEAAGISRFKAKKVEAQRRLERVDQNLLRLSDIVEEVGNRLRSVRSQATKARRYREYSERLQQLRTQVAMAEWRELTEKLEQAEGELQRLGDQVARFTAELTAEEALGLELETEIDCVAETMREREHRAARNREKIAGQESTTEHERLHMAELEAEAARYRSQLAALNHRADDIRQRVDMTRVDLTAAQEEYEQVAGQLRQQSAEVTDWSRKLDNWRRAVEQQRTEHLAGVRRAAQLSNEITLQKTRRKSAESRLVENRQRLNRLVADRNRCEEQLQQAQRSQLAASEQITKTASELEEATRTLDENDRFLSRRRDELALQRGRLSGICERADLLDELERRKEGLTAGVQQVLSLARSAGNDSPFQAVIGLVADVLQVPMQWAPLLDAALGPVAQHVVVRDGRVIDLLESGTFRPAGRVGFLSLDDVRLEVPGDPSFDDQLGVLGRLDQLVQVEAPLQPLIRQLLGRTWAVEMLTHARRLRAAGAEDIRFITLAGEVLNTDGSLVAGPKDVAGLISRRTELRDLRQEEGVLRQQIAEAEEEIGRLAENIKQQQVAVRGLGQEHQQQSGQLAACEVKTHTLRNQLQQLAEEIAGLEAQRQVAENELGDVAGETEDAESELRRLEQQSAQLEHSIHADEQRIEQGEASLQQCVAAQTKIQVDLGKSEQRLEGLRTQLSQYEDEQQERAGAIAEASTQLADTMRRHQTSARAILGATSQLASLYLVKETLAREIAQQQGLHGELVSRRGHLSDQLKRKQREIAVAREQLHQCELGAGEVRHERGSLADRIREDYGLEIAELTDEFDEQQQQENQAAEEEIAALRRKISNIGAVNMEALNELDDLETRFASLDGQYQDLTQAKESLERIIHKINADSRRLFSETLAAIRTNFQTLYRRAFGGGRADIMLEEGVDILECGIDIVATPPGKPSFNNSLLSGGEKALTAVALLLAIFQYRPSPFCVLDEVDAPFDEANIGRFVDVLKDFLGWTKFVLVTHSKKTMTAATTLYGVTMQESGVSKQVSVRFEDVSDDGHISDEALRRQEAKGDDERAA
jgi:chromosome segregation protein